MVPKFARLAGRALCDAKLPPAPVEEDGSGVFPTPISAETLKTVSEKVSLVPEGFHINPKMVGQLARRAKMGTGEVPMDWGFAEAMAFGSIRTSMPATPCRRSTTR